jgi:hypothetical protein
MTMKTALKRILKGILHREEEDKHNHESMSKDKSHQKNR